MALADVLFLGAVLVLAPLATRLATSPAAPGRFAWTWRWAGYARTPAAPLLAVSFFLAPGPWAAVLAVPWLLVAGLFALGAVARLCARGLRPWSELSLDLGLLFFPVGAAWAFAYRLGIAPLGFGGQIALLTAAHFHVAGLVLSVAIGMLGRVRPVGPLVLGLAVGLPVTAIGFTASPPLEWLGAWMVAATGLLAGILHVLEGRRSPLFAVAGLAMIVAMALAAVYAYARWPSIPVMVATHAVLNVVGFGACAMVGWTRERPADP